MGHPRFAPRRLAKPAALAAELGDKQRALKLFNDAYESPETGDWKPAAFPGALRPRPRAWVLQKGRGDVGEIARRSSDDQRAEVLMLMGDSFRQLGNARARAIYDRLPLQFQIPHFRRMPAIIDCSATSWTMQN